MSRVTVGQESASEALDRAAEGLCVKILGTAQRAADELEPGNVIRVAGEWAGVVERFDGRRLRLVREGSACEWVYHPTLGETFIWDQGGF